MFQALYQVSNDQLAFSAHHDVGPVGNEILRKQARVDSPCHHPHAGVLLLKLANLPPGNRVIRRDD